MSTIEIGSQIIAEDLSKLGVKRGSHVAIGGRNSLNWVLTFFAIQKLGAIAMLMNFNLTIDEIIRMSHSADITHLCYGKMNAITDEEQFKTTVTGEDSFIDHMYDIGNHIDFFARRNEYEVIKDKHRSKVEADDVAVMIFTSGSTGNPKAVMLSAANIINSAKTRAEDLHLSSDDIDCMVSPIPDDFYGEIVGAAVLMKEDCTFDEESAREYVKKRLAKFKWPEHYVVYKKFPQLSNGKVDGVSLKKDFIERVKEKRYEKSN